MQLTTEVEGERETIGTMLIGRDHEKDQVSVWGVWADQQTHGKVEVGEGTAKWSETGAKHDGRKGSGNVVMKVEGNKLMVDVTDVKWGDDAQPEMHLTFTPSQRRGRGGQ